MSDALVREVASRSRGRLDLWAALLTHVRPRRAAEIGVYRGEFAARILGGCPGIETYYMVDPWRHLDDWNKPANRDDETFERIFARAMAATAPYEHRRVVLRGRTTEVIDQIPDGSLDFAYVDGDHTLRGIAVDLTMVHAKIRAGGWIGGDDFSPNIWQHGRRFEPTLVFPFAVHFAEAVGATIYGLPHKQFLIETQTASGFVFVDLTGRYGRVDLRSQLDGRAPRRSDSGAGRGGRAKLAQALSRLRLTR